MKPRESPSKIMRRRSITAAVLLTACRFATANAQMPVDFQTQIKPLLADRCFACHGPDEAKRESDLRLDRRSDAFAERDGGKLIVPGDPAASPLFQRITHADREQRMPPADQPRQLKPAEIDLIGRWISEGAEWTGHWAFSKLQRPTPPTVSDDADTRNAIDNFILRRLELEQIQPAPSAGPETLIRRASLALTGLPPTPAEIDTFLSDDSSGAFERLIDGLLASPRYGEHMARTWLDAARYADTDGYQNDRIRYMWAWRDWLIMALNEGKPFDEFTIEQLAGDMLPDATLYQQVATGFGRNHRINSEGGSIPDEWIVEYVVDRVDTLGTVWLGLTIGCARCHDHKYDPISQMDYYRLFAYFNNVPEWGLGPNDGNSPPFITMPENWPNLSPEQNRKIAPKPYELVTTQTSVVRPKPGDKKTLMVLEERQERRPTYRLNRGQYNLPDKSEELLPGLPDSLNANGAVPGDRLGLARWLVDSGNPLTARVIVNGYWQQFFGTGLVETSENFGTQGQPPSHPDLLDWLATEFVRSRWDVKRMHRLIVTSATFRQSSDATSALLERDPNNRLLARGPRVRLPAHVIRDQALAVSGLLVEQLGGPSVKPYMPPGIWRSISNNKYEQDKGPSLYRRSLYTYWRRTIPPPTMMTFNSAEREVCLVRKDRTNTPLQALTLMNNVTFVEAARFLAERMIREGGERSVDQIAFGFRLAAGRHPRSSELKSLREAYVVFDRHFRQHRDEASQLLSVGEKPRDVSLPLVQHAAYTMVANVLLNLDEFISLE